MKPSLDDLTPEQREALLRFRAKEGAHWKSKLSVHWMMGTDERLEDSGLLRQIRNQRGPTWLSRLTIKEE